MEIPNVVNRQLISRVFLMCACVFTFSAWVVKEDIQTTCHLQVTFEGPSWTW